MNGEIFKSELTLDENNFKTFAPFPCAHQYLSLVLLFCHCRFGMVMYDSMGEFFHGFHEVRCSRMVRSISRVQADTGLVRPYGLAIIPGTDGDQVTRL